ncbi:MULTISPECIES: hypothetical protein [unclassified Streptomyces]|uniref:hypothetical protein n=1 Tax=unclassified Streptomyces TaxID=2593676 RepID=UPI000DC7B49F|nr:MULTISPECIES: hypothetical protein [unclassified Streptomyces]AWZ10093.1 hypothetical protein DRB89_05970 [Streptomyces sp. ICC4]AWZ17753.1 hypothetical protein DRB96_05505 [Streptomyces sp. ICC1]
MDLLLAGHAAGHGLRTAASLRRSHPFDKELQVAGLVHGLGRAEPTARALRPLLGERVARLVRLQAPGPGAPGPGAPADAGTPADAGADVEALRLAVDTGRGSGPEAGVLEDWRPVLELVAAGAYDRTG